MKFKRKWTCGICNQDVIADTEAYTITCQCGTIPFPQWVIVDAYSRRKYLDKLLDNFECYTPPPPPPTKGTDPTETCDPTGL